MATYVYFGQIFAAKPPAGAQDTFSVFVAKSNVRSSTAMIDGLATESGDQSRHACNQLFHVIVPLC